MGEEDADCRDTGNARRRGKGRTGQRGMQCSGCRRPALAGARPFPSAGEAGSRPSPRSRKVGAARGDRTGSAPCTAPYLLVDDGASHLADVRQAVVPGRVLQQQHRLAAQADLQMEGDAPGRGRDGSQERGWPRAGPRHQRRGGRRCRRRHGQQRAGRPQDRRGAHRAAGRAEGRGAEQPRAGAGGAAAEKFCRRGVGSFFLREPRRKIKTFRKSPRAGGGREDEEREGSGGGKMAEAGGLRRRERGRRTGEAPPPPPWSSRRALAGTGGGSARPGRRAPGGGGEGGARGGEGELEAGTAETPPGGRRSRRSSGRAAAVAAGCPVAAPSALGSPGLSLPEPGQDCAAGLGAASAAVVRTSPPGLRSPLVGLPRGSDGGDGVHLLRPASQRRRLPPSPPPVPNTPIQRTSTSGVTCDGPKNASPAASRGSYLLSVREKENRGSPETHLHPASF